MSFDEKYLGQYYVDGNNILYKFLAYCESPTVTLENVETKEKISFGINGLSAQDYTRLVKEQQ